MENTTEKCPKCNSEKIVGPLMSCMVEKSGVTFYMCGCGTRVYSDGQISVGDACPGKKKTL
jgi:transcription elongation factor Elf1